jgi:hypothetical protein
MRCKSCCSMARLAFESWMASVAMAEARRAMVLARWSSVRRAPRNRSTGEGSPGGSTIRRRPEKK